VHVFRRFFSILFLAAYVSATILTVVPTAMAAPNGMAGEMTGMTMQADGPGDKMPMPCKMKPDCVTEIGCIFMVSLPAPDLAVTTPVVWSAVRYSMASEFLDGRSTQPLLGPPISRA
jgi:hypothetical protein